MVERLTPHCEKVEKITLTSVESDYFADITGGELTVADETIKLSGDYEIDYSLPNIKGKIKIGRWKFDGNPDSGRVDSFGSLYIENKMDSQSGMYNIGFPTEIRSCKRDIWGTDVFFIYPKTEKNESKILLIWIAAGKDIKIIADENIDEKESVIHGLEDLDKDIRKELIASRRLYEVKPIRQRNPLFVEAAVKS